MSTNDPVSASDVLSEAPMDAAERAEDPPAPAVTDDDDSIEGEDR